MFDSIQYEPCARMFKHADNCHVDSYFMLRISNKLTSMDLQFKIVYRILTSPFCYSIIVKSCDGIRLVI